MKLIFHSFPIGDVEDPEIAIADPIHKWQQTDHGKWVMEHAIDLAYHIAVDDYSLGYRVAIHGYLEHGPQVTEYLLRWNLAS
jgi:hypothetical protein